MATDRLQKILAQAGIASRRAAEALIVAGRVRVNGRVVTELGVKADGRDDRIDVDDKRIVLEAPAYVILHKPRGVVSTMSDPEGRPTVRELLKSVPVRVYPIGRLDFATSGVLLATNDGEFAEGLMHPRKSVPKTYVLKVKGTMHQEDVERWRQGVRLEDGMTLPAEAKLLRHEEDKTWLELTIHEGRNQQIRRMGEATGYRVMRLARIAFAGISSEGLRPGEWRALTREELQGLKKAFGVPKRVPSSGAVAETAATPAHRRVNLTMTRARSDDDARPRTAPRGRVHGGASQRGASAHGHTRSANAGDDAMAERAADARARGPGRGRGRDQEAGGRGSPSHERASVGERGGAARGGAARGGAPRGRGPGRGGGREEPSSRGASGRGRSPSDGATGRGRGREEPSSRGAPDRAGARSEGPAGRGRGAPSGRSAQTRGGAGSAEGRSSGPGRDRSGENGRSKSPRRR